MTAADERSSEQRAYDKGVAASNIQARLDAHADRLSAINGSIDRTAAELSRICEGLKGLTNEVRTREKINAALAETVKSAAANQVTTRTFAIGLVMMAIALAGLYLGAK